MKEKNEPYINSEELITIWVGWEMDYKDPYSQQQVILLAMLLIWQQ
jgi:hypothetical protein